MNQPRYVGITILALAKVALYEFPFVVMKKNFKDSRLLSRLIHSHNHITHPPEVDVYVQLKQSGCVDFSNPRTCTLFKRI